MTRRASISSNIRKVIGGLSIVGLATACSGGLAEDGAPEADDPGVSSQNLWSIAGANYWPNGQVRVCFDNGVWTYSSTAIANWRAKVESWVKTEISPFAGVTFTDFTTCSGEQPSAWLRLVGVPSSNSSNARSGGYRTDVDNRIRFNSLQTKEVVLHEFMHALGYAHEFDHQDTDGCHAREQSAAGGTPVTRYDFYSILNSTGYCHSLNNLSAWDRAGLSINYGTRSNTFRASFSGGDSVDPAWTDWVSVASTANPSGSGAALTLSNILVGNFTEFNDEDYGADDFLATTSSGWYVSPKGYQPWYQVNSSSIGAASLIVGDFNGDQISDLLRIVGTNWNVSWSASTSWTTINTTSSTVPKSELLVGDFDGDGIDDLLRVTGNKWYLSSGASSALVEINSSSALIEDMKVGDFDGTGGDDVFYGDGSTWRYSAGATGAWQTLATSSVQGRELLVGNFDGLGHDDVFSTNAGKWRISAEANSNWVDVATSAYTVSSLRVANFGLGKGFSSAARVKHSVFRE